MPTYDWAQFLGEHFRRVPRMKTYHHFSFSRDSPGVVTLKAFSDSDCTTFPILTDDSWEPSAAQLPRQILPHGLSEERQAYLYREIREFCRPGTEDLVCPLPPTPMPDTHGTQGEERPPVNSVTEPPPAKRPRMCGICGNPGHTRRTCPESRD